MTAPSLAHLRRLTDDTGLLQHALYSVGDPRHGYTLDDNARALGVAVGLVRAGLDASDLVDRYLRFAVHAVRSDGRFRNLLGYDRRWIDDVASDDAHGHAVAAFGLTAAIAAEPAARDLAAVLVAPALAHLEHMPSPRGIAHGIIGLCWLKAAGLGDPGLLERLCGRLVTAYDEQRATGWEWFEPLLTYDNGRLPLALLLAGAASGRERYIQVGRTALDFLLRTVCAGGCLDLIGNRGWYHRGGERARFDQQPVDAASVAEAAIAAHVLLGEARYLDAADAAADWFTGRNRTGAALLDAASGACCDGLEPAGVNRNQGAESALAPLQTWLARTDPAWVVPCYGKDPR
ncbi:MAG: hypothetical protein ACRD0K_19630 [Egibacteraceae bacterium]